MHTMVSETCQSSINLKKKFMILKTNVHLVGFYSILSLMMHETMNVKFVFSCQVSGQKKPNLRYLLKKSWTWCNLNVLSNFNMDLLISWFPCHLHYAIVGDLYCFVWFAWSPSWLAILSLIWRHYSSSFRTRNDRASFWNSEQYNSRWFHHAKRCVYMRSTQTYWYSILLLIRRDNQMIYNQVVILNRLHKQKKKTLNWVWNISRYINWR
jgi:hypothetical protein